MLQILAIRQTFIVAEWLLILFLICGATFLSMNYLTGRIDPADEVDAATSETISTGPIYALAQVKSRPEYESIISSRLFGPAGQVPRDVASTETPTVPPTTLRLKLCGTAATSPKDIYASAIILNEENNSIQSFGIGDQVVDQVLLEEIYQRKVILFNKQENRREELCSDNYDTKTEVASPAPANQPASTRTANRVTVKKAEVIQDLMTNYADIATQIKPELYRDENNNITGITASNLSSIPLAGKLGVQDGDVLQSVNNEPIDSEEKVMQLINKYRNASMIRVGILRQGRPVSLTIKFE